MATYTIVTDTILQENITITKEKLAEKQDIIQYSTLPTASSTYEDVILQYIGSDEDYTTGGFYQCVLDSDTSTYSWEEISTKITIDSALSSSSTNPVQNAIITSALDEKQDTMEEITAEEVDALW